MNTTGNMLLGGAAGFGLGGPVGAVIGAGAGAILGSMPTGTRPEDLDLDAMKSALRTRIIELRDAGSLDEAAAGESLLIELDR